MQSTLAYFARAQRFQRSVEDKLISRLKSSATRAFHLADIFSDLRAGIQTVANDDFSKCFQSHPPFAWNFNFYLYPLWVLVRLFLLELAQHFYPSHTRPVPP
jgi:hypothetical protein